jgi:uncharacterized protein YdeI (YjbR/CyaY-like superfamily)
VTPRFFATVAKFRAWLRANHRRESELWIGFYKKATGKRGITYHEALDEALCFGWIDGVRETRDAESYVQRFTPRRKGSVWSAVNIRKVGELIAAKRMHAAGLKTFEDRDPRKVQLYSFEQREAVALTSAETKRIRADRAAWTFFEQLPPGYKRTITWYVVSAKRPETRARRLARLIEASAAGRRL